MVNFEWYRTFKTIYECNSISEAAKKLYMTQPGVSKHLAALEAQIGKKLFIRTARKTLPTEFGKFLYIQVSSSVINLENAEEKFSKAGNKQCLSIVIGCQYDYFNQVLLDKLPELDINITVHFGSEKALAKDVEDGKVHLLLGTHKYNTYPHNFSKLEKEKLVLVASNDLEIPIELMDVNTHVKVLEPWLKEQYWFAYDNELPFVNRFWNHHFNKRPQIMANIVFASFPGIIRTMKKMKGLCIMPLYACEKALKNKEIKLVNPNLNETTNKLFCSHKFNSENLYEIRLFKERLNLPL